MNASISHALRHAIASLAPIEASAREISIDVPSEPLPDLLGDAVEAAEILALTTWDRFREWNAALIEREAHLLPPSPERLRAREVGRSAHGWYEATKPVYRRLEIVRSDPAIQMLYAEATMGAWQGNRIAKAFLRARNESHPMRLGAR